MRRADLDQLERIAARFRPRRFLTDLALDPPDAAATKLARRL